MQSMSEFYTQLRAAEESLSRGQVSTALCRDRLQDAGRRRPLSGAGAHGAEGPRPDQHRTGGRGGAGEHQARGQRLGFVLRQGDRRQVSVRESRRATCCSTTSTRCSRPAGSSTRSSPATSRSSSTRRPGANWRPRPGMEGSAPSSATIRQYQRAAVIRDSFFKPGAAQAQVTRRREAGRGIGSERGHVRARRARRTGCRPASVVRVQWPAATPGAGTKITVAGAPAIASDGPWALFRVLDKGTAQPGAQPGLVRLAFAADAKRSATLELQPTSVNNPFQSRELYEFQCPGPEIAPSGARGLYGKLPGARRFPEPPARRGVHRRLGRVAAARDARTAARRSASAGWRCFLSAPVWRFVLPAGMYSKHGLGRAAWPSVDRVGRYFPLTLAAPLHQESIDVPATLARACPGSIRSKRSRSKRSTPELDFDAFDQRLAGAPAAGRAARRIAARATIPFRWGAAQSTFQVMAIRAGRRRRHRHARADGAVARTARGLGALADARREKRCRRASPYAADLVSGSQLLRHAGRALARAFLDAGCCRSSDTAEPAERYSGKGNVTYCTPKNPGVDLIHGQGRGQGEAGPLTAPPGSANGADMNTGLEK